MTRLDALTDRIADAGEIDIPTLPVYGPWTPTVDRLVASSGPDGELVSWDTESPIVAHHQYLMREWISGEPRLVSYTHAEMVERFERVDGVVGGGRLMPRPLPSQLKIVHQPDGWWAIYPPGTSDEAIAALDLPPISEGPSRWSDIIGDWARPNTDDVMHAVALLQAGAL